MKQFDKVKYPTGSKENRRLAFGYFVATIPENLRKNKAKHIIIDEDFNARRVTHVVRYKDEFISYKYCRKQKPAEKIRPPSDHFNGATRFAIKENCGVLRKGEIVEYVPSEDEQPLKWLFQKVYPALFLGAPVKAYIHFNNLIPIHTEN